MQVYMVVKNFWLHVFPYLLVSGAWWD